MRFPLIEDFFSLVFPKTCCLCRRSLFEFEDQFCKICISKLPITNYHLRPQNNDLVVKIMGLTKPNLVLAFLRFTKKGDSQKILHQLKYKNRAAIGVELGRIYGNILKESGYQNQWDQIIPVPLHILKQKRRGYNQSEQFAIGISQAMDIPVKLALKRTEFTETQTNKSRMERIQNVDGVFLLQEGHRVENQRILLVDDVMTTGATLSTCANVLLKAKCMSVDIAVIAAGKS